MVVMEQVDLQQTLPAAVERAMARMGLEVSAEALQRIGQYGDELQKWNKAYNLVGRRIGAEGIAGLVADAVTALSIRGLLEGGKEVVDIGSGAGLPGIPLYILAGPFSLTLAEPQRKKISFLRHVCRRLSLQEVRVFPGRLEEMAKEEDHLNAFDVALARAVMDPMRLVRLAKPLLCEGGQLVVYVGKSDAERMRKEGRALHDKGLRLEAVRSTQRIVGKENSLVVIRKEGR